MKCLHKEDIPNISYGLPNSHKGQNGRLLLIGGSHFFHAASLWSLTTASRLVDLVHYASVPENNELVRQAKEEFRHGIVVPRQDIEKYIEEDDVVLIGPGMVRFEGEIEQKMKDEFSLAHIDDISDEGIQTYLLTNYLLKKFPRKQWIIDAGALQMLDLEVLPHGAILTPHHGEFARLLQKFTAVSADNLIQNVTLEEQCSMFAKRFQCIVLVKGEKDIIANGIDGADPDEVYCIEGGNVGMTKGGTGDVLAGLIAGLACTHDPLSAVLAGSYINKQAGDDLFGEVGPFFNASDLAMQVPKTMKRLFIHT